MTLALLLLSIAVSGPQAPKPEDTLIHGADIYLYTIPPPTLQDTRKFCSPIYVYGPDEVPVIVECPPLQTFQRATDSIAANQHTDCVLIGIYDYLLLAHKSWAQHGYGMDS